MNRDPLIGSSLANRYKVSRFVDEGRMSRIYVATDKVEKRRVALKILHPLLVNVKAQVRRFQREFEVTSQIDHPNCVQMYEFGQADGHHFLVMEYLNGKGLDTYIGNGKKMAPQQAARIALQVAGALEAAHKIDVIHRDVNPSNVMLCKIGTHRDVVKVLDFGLAHLQGNGEQLTGVGERLGTVHYMAPECIQDTGLDNRSDLYGLGCVMFEMLTGRTPFVGPTLRVLESQVRAEPPAPSSLEPGTPLWLDALVLQLLQKSPDDRPPDAAAVVEVLTRGIEKLKVTLDIKRAAQADAVPSREKQRPIIPSGVGHSSSPFEAARFDARALEPIFVPHRKPKHPKWLWIVVMITAAMVISSLLGTLLTWWMIPG